MVALASAFIRLRPQVDKTEFTKAGADAGKVAGAAAGKGVSGGIDEGLQRAKARAAATGGEAGKAWGDGFHRDSQGKIRDSQGKFVASSITGGTNAGKGFAKGFNKGSSDIIGSIKANLGLAAGVFVPLGLAAAVGEIAKIGMAYEDNLNIFKAVTKSTGAQMDQVAAKARALGADVTLPGVSAAGAAAAMTELAKAGLTVSQSMDAAKGTLQLARVASLSEAQAAEITGNAINAFGLKAKDTTFVVDELAAAANSSSIEVTDASLSFKQAAAVFSAFQVPTVGSKEAITELNTAIAILGNNGIKGSDAGTSLKQMLLQLTGPTEHAKTMMQELAYAAGGANIPIKLQTDIMHGTAKEYRKGALELQKLNPSLKGAGDIAYDASGKMRPLKDIIDLVTRGTKNMTAEERDFTITQIFGADSARAVISLMKGGLPVYEAQRRAVMEQGAAASFAAAKNAGLKGAIDNVKSQVENASISIYNAVKGPLTTGLNGLANRLPGIFNSIGGVFSFLGAHIGTIKAVGIAILGLIAITKLHAAAMAVETAGGVISWLTQYAAGLRVTAIATKVAAAAQWLFNGAIAFITSPIGIVVAAVVALIAVFVLLFNHNKTFHDFVIRAWNGIKVAVAVVVAWFSTSVVPVLKAVWSAIATGATFLWRNVVLPVFSAWRAYMSNVLFPVLRFLYDNVVKPVFAWIGRAIAIWWGQARTVFGALRAFFVAVIFPVIRALYDNVARPVFQSLSRIVTATWIVIQIAFKAWWAYMTNILFPLIRFFYNNVVKPIFSAVVATVSNSWNIIKALLSAWQTKWAQLGAALSLVWTKVLRPLLLGIGNFILNNVVPGFKRGVDGIRAAWAKVQDAARVPVAFVVNHVINPFINGINAAASVFGIKDRVGTIKGFNEGGEVLAGYANGGRIAGPPSSKDNRWSWLRDRTGNVLGRAGLATGEFVVNAADTAKALPLLTWINNGMKGGPNDAARRIGRPMTEYPGDGSEGWAFKDGGLVGFVKDVWGAFADPTKQIKAPFEAALSQVPGGGLAREFVLGAGRRLLNGAIGWLSGPAIGGAVGSAIGQVAAAANAIKARSFVQQQNGKPYVWASAGPGGYDCSGIVSAAYNIMKGRSPYSHTFSTESAGSFFKPGLNGSLLAGWSHPGQSPASARVGHMAGQIAGLPFESTGSRGVHIGASARRVTQFAQVGHFADGGRVGLMDNGGAWPSGTVRANMSGHTEQVLTGGPSGDIGEMLSLLRVIADRIGGVGGDVAEQLASGQRKAVQLGRSRGATGAGRV